MIELPDEIEALARKIADARGVSVEDVVAEAIEQSASRTPLSRRRMTVAEMLAVGDEIAALPLLDPRSPKELMEDVNAL
jgi:antitoxin VapB